MNNNTAVVFVSDRDYVVPTLVSALQVQESTKHIENVFVYIVWVGLGENALSLLNDFCHEMGINTRFLQDMILPEGASFNPTHVPKSSLSRFLAVELLPENIKNVIYLDGDIQITGSIDSLIKHEVKPGFIAAANDKFWLGDFGRKKSQNSYLSKLGVSPHEYFNAGVMSFRKETWLKEAPNALKFFVEHSDLCRFHDQSALNVIFKKKREYISPKYNYISDYTLIDAEDIVKPSIIHFTGGLKPWFYYGPPWGDRFKNSYESLMRKNKNMDSFLTLKSAEQQKGMAYFYRKQYLMHNMVLIFMRINRRRKMRRYMNEGLFEIS